MKEKGNNKNRIIIIFAFIIFLIISLAIKAGIYIHKWQKLAKEMINNSPSIILDSSYEEIAKIGNNKNTKNSLISNIPDNLKNAYISIEDQRFYSHSGVDLPRTASAIFSYIKNLGSSSFGGSSITQQLVKNLTGDNSSKVSRKISEWIKAFSLEEILSKDEILEAYLNIIYVGPNIYGVSLGSEYYFSKDLSNLSLAECAFLAGINNSPNSYNPFDTENDNSNKIKKRTITVLKKMLDLGYIDNNDFEKASNEVNYGLNFKCGKIISKKDSNIYSYHTDALINELVTDISKKEKISETFATNYLEMAGLKIYSTVNSKIQAQMETEVQKGKYLLKSAKTPDKTSQAAMVIIDHKTGYVVRMCTVELEKKILQEV